ncbi:hypothetical protein LGM38_17365 [Burkholderia vietnamiensis]|uniref:hypothetical protein n=1 Tax=Burkholderia vietnamiensis TaxID=60552 RepID=UPI001CF2177F|nr:hypothetical protein [Burkholderia vietnamiensis]MCA8013819.1 hypothetical protein [Burkholderia vietnamiensis]
MDTTLVVEFAEKSPLAKTWGNDHVKVNTPAETPYYALRELLAGKVRYLCDAHNRLQAAESLPEALDGLLKLPPVSGRKRDVPFKALVEELGKAYQNDRGGTLDDHKREMLQSLALRVTRLWNNARKAKHYAVIQHLACFNEGALSRGTANTLRGPSDSFECLASERCAAAAYIYDDQAALSKMVNALRVDNLDPAASEKNENRKRRAALKDLKAKGPKEFPRRRCRALGDAYFAAMCPAGSDVVTTNSVDHLPLCTALGKKVASPP